MIELSLVRAATVVIASGVGAYTDHRTGYIFDWTTLPLIGLGLVLNAVEQEFLGIGMAVVVFILGYIFYYTGKLGGGDLKLYTGITMMLPFYSGGTFILSVILLSAFAAMVFLSSYYMVKYAAKGIDFSYNRQGIIRAGIVLAFALAYFYILMGRGFVSLNYALVFAAPISLGVLFLAFEKGIRKEFFLKKIMVSEIEEDEILAPEFMGEEERKTIAQGFRGVIGEKEKKWLEEKGIKEICVYRNLPRFGAFIFIGVALALFMPSFMEFVASGGL